MNLPMKKEKLFEVITNFTLLKELLPDQVKECKIIEQNNNETITEELLKFNTYFGDKKMTQRTSHKIINPDVIVK